MRTEKIWRKAAVVLNRAFSPGKRSTEEKWKRVLQIFAMGTGAALFSWIMGKEESKGIFILGILAASGSWFLSDMDMRKKKEYRQKQMLAEYPAIVSKLTLYLGAGMNLKKAFQKTAKEGRKTANPVYEEMRLACGEMDDGISEAESYLRFGKRIGLQKYLRLSTLLVQNLKKGNTVLLIQLKQEAFLAMEEQRGEIKKLGEEMGTKLLFPMILMMGVTMVLIIVPAFLSI